MLMKKNISILLLSILFSVSACSGSNISNVDNGSNNNPSSNNEGGNNNNQGQDSTPKKVNVSAHTLSDSNPPINVSSKGQVMNENSWDSFRNASSSKFNGNYNYTYRAYSGGYLTTEAFTKNGYYLQSISGSLYYERKSGNTFYSYASTNEGYLRSETTLDIQSKYTYRIQNEIYVHMFDFSNYEYDDFDGTYRYYGNGFTAAAKFQGGYLTYLYYILGINFFEIKSSFETTIDIPASYYYE